MKDTRFVRTKYRLFLALILSLSIVLMVLLGLRYIEKTVPEKINMARDQVKTINLNLPIIGEADANEANSNNTITVNFSSPISFRASEVGEYKFNLKLFGVFDLKTLTINVLDEKQIVPCGVQVGIYIKTEGILVVNTGNIVDIQGNSASPCENKVKAGDYILKINGESVNTKSELSNYVNQYGDGNIILTIKRNDEVIEVMIKAILDASNQYKVGLWVRDDAQGIGTLTYIDGDSNFGALGHGISDVDTAKILTLQNGLLYRAKVLSIVKGKSGEPGEFVGAIDYNSSNKIGAITKNCTCGIYGKIDSDIVSEYNLKPMDVGYRYDVHKGKAYVRLSINNIIKDYEIEITNVNSSENVETKNITFKVTSEELLEITGGVVQGMSGSPILQDEKVVGAVTHVFVDNSTYGYGIFIETMLSNMND